MARIKPEVWRSEEGRWIADLDHGAWVDRTSWPSWEKAMEHALWIGLCAGVWSM